MKSFLKNILSSCLGTLLAFAIIILIGIFIFYSYTKQAKIAQNGVLHIQLSGMVTDYDVNGIDLYNFSFAAPKLTLWELRKKINAASHDDKIDAIFLECLDGGLSQQMVTELSAILQNFKSTGKKIYAYSNYYDQNPYLLSTFADSIFLNPNGGVDLKGYAVFSPFFDNILEKWDIDLHVFYAGRYKSGTEPYRLDSFSVDNESQLRAYIAQLEETMINWMRDNRNVEKAKVLSIIKGSRTFDSKFLEANGIIDEVLYRDEVIDLLNGLYEDEELVKLSSYEIPNTSMNDEVAVVFAQGEILWNTNGTSGITHEEYSKIFNSLRENEQIKKVILRLDSPGGNGYTSDLLHREVELLKQSGKKVYASFGGFATSGAYYLASAADSIFSTDNTMTGSIGVYIMLPTFENFLQRHLDVNVDTVLGMGGSMSYTPLVALTDEQQKSFQNQTDRLYQIFLEKVAEGRNMNITEVHEVAQGRIWSGREALDQNLVDELMSFDQLITAIAGNKLPKTYPEKKIGFSNEIWKQSMGGLKSTFNNDLKMLETKVVEIQKLMEKPSPLMRIPYFLNVTNQ